MYTTKTQKSNQWNYVTLGTGSDPLPRAPIHFAEDPDDHYIELIYSNVFNPSEWNYQAAETFVQLVEERTESHVAIEFHGLYS